MAQDKAPAKEQSMEEILQSIKRIIAEENDGAPSAGMGGDVLELTDLVDGELTDPLDEEPVPEPLKAQTPTPPPPAPRPAAASPIPTSVVESDTLVAMPIADEPRETAKDVLSDIDSLLSDETRKASSAALKSLNEVSKKPAAPASKPVAAMNFRSGVTLEDLVIEALKPMLKDWLEANLTPIVEDLVAKEIKKLSMY